MIKMRNLDNTLKHEIQGGGYNVGWHGGVTGGLGGFKYVDYSSGGSHGDGSSWDEPFSNLTDALTAMKKWDTVFIAPGGESNNFSTPLDAIAPFSSIIGMRQGDMGIAAWLAQSATGSPLLNIRARGMRISGIEFDGTTVNPSIMCNGRANSMRADYTQIDHCAFFAGQYQIELDGEDGPLLYVTIADNYFENCSVSCIWNSNTGYAVPRGCLIERNIFTESAAYIDMQGRGLNQAVIRNNSFQGTGIQRTAVDDKLIDLSGGGYNIVHGNFFGIADGTGANGYDETNGVLKAGTSDTWVGNYHTGGVTDKNPASGS